MLAAVGDIAALDTKALASYTTAAHSQSTVEFLLNVIPSTVVDAFAKGEILQVLLFSLLFGFALSSAGEAGRPVVSFIDKVAHALFIVVGFIMRLAPIGAFGAMAFTIGKYGIGSLQQLAQFRSAGEMLRAYRGEDAPWGLAKVVGDERGTYAVLLPGDPGYDDTVSRTLNGWIRLVVPAEEGS